MIQILYLKIIKHNIDISQFTTLIFQFEEINLFSLTLFNETYFPVNTSSDYLSDHFIEKQLTFSLKGLLTKFQVFHHLESATNSHL